jgi:hypothetical protein
MARQRPLAALPRHVLPNWSRQTTAASGLRSISTETPVSEEKDGSTASTEEKAKTGAPPAADVKEDPVAKMKEERDDLVVRLYLSPLPLGCLLIASLLHACTRRTVYGMPRQT